MSVVTAIACVAGCGSDREIPAAPAATLHRLTVEQYQNTVKAMLGEDIVIPALEPDIKLSGFTSIATGELTIAPLALEQYEHAARDLAHQVVSSPARRDAVIGCSEPIEPCIGEFFARFGRRAWRRPITDADLALIDRVVTAARAALAGAGAVDPWTPIEYGMALVLQSPEFLYRVELGEVSADNPSRRILTGYEMASRLAFVLTDTGPDDDLLDAAAAGKLDRQDGLYTHAAELLDQPRGRRALARFYSEYLNLERLDEMSKDPILYPQMNDALKAGMRTELEALFTHFVFEEDADYRQIFTTDQTFVNAELAALYGVEPPTADELASGLPAQRSLSAESFRGGLVSAAGLLAIYADSAATSPTRRGRFVRQNLLCENMPPPPPNVETTFPDLPGASIREKLTAHRENPACASCHALMDPIGLGFERFDAIGQLRTEEAPGLPVDDSGDVDGVVFHGARELGELLASDARVPPCFVRQFYRFATGHLERMNEELMIDDLSDAFAGTGFRVKDLVLRVVTSSAFRDAGTPTQGKTTATEEMP